MNSGPDALKVGARLDGETGTRKNMNGEDPQQRDQKRKEDDDRTAERKHQQRAREMENLKDDKELTRKVYDLRMKLFEAGMEINKKSRKVANLEKDWRAKVDRIKEWEHKVKQ